ncbi:MAG: hypothetical protein H6741_26525 [Alphaproteobacteria bacterium]|nr:hypothetical protein [Alphaproteobacteria bacterium]
MRRALRVISAGGALAGLASLLWGGLPKADQAPEPVPRLSASTLTPAPGQRVQLELAGDVDLLKPRWRGAEPTLDPLVAALEIPADAPPGQRLRVEAERGAQTWQVELEVQAAVNEGPLPSPPTKLRSLPWVSGTCVDARATRLAGIWATGCGAGVVDRAQQLVSGEQLRLERGVTLPAIGPGLLWAMGRPYGAWFLPAVAPVSTGPLLQEALVSPPATDGRRVALLTQDAVTTSSLGENTRQRSAARPAPWYPPAVSERWVAWVDAGARDTSGEDIHVLGPDDLSPLPLVAKAGHQRHVAASERWLAWIEDDAVAVQDLTAPERRSHAADAHTARGLSSWGPVACWEQWTGAEVDLACSDGLVVQRPGDQRGPSRFGPWLLFREGPQVLLVTAEWILMDDDDLRAQALGPRVADPEALRGARVEGGVVYTVSLPEGLWQVERHGPEGWVSGERLSGGPPSRIEAPWGDAVRLRGPLPPPRSSG